MKTTNKHSEHFSGNGLPRRDWLQRAACGFGGLALSSLLMRSGSSATFHHHQPRAKRVIFIYLQGGPSQVDTYDFKPKLARYEGKEVEFLVPRTRKVEKRKVMQPFWNFRQYGESGRWSSSIFPEVAKHVDDLCFIHSMHTEGVAHGPATLFLHTGATNLIRPSMGAWVSYGLGSENENLPAFVSINPPANKGGPRNYGNAFLPAQYQATVLGRPGDRNAEAEIRNLVSPVGPEKSRTDFDFLQKLNQEQVRGRQEPVLEGAIQSFELAWRMQSHARGIVNVDRETESMRKSYGISPGAVTDGFGRQSLAARQLAEAGVRFIQISHCDNNATPVWDQHSNMPKHEELAAQVDRPIAGLLEDLKQRGLLEDTLVWCGSEFGRTPFSQGNNGRDHNPRGFTVWLAGGGTRPGYAHGATDEWGFQAMEDKVHMHDLHASILHLMGIDHEKLTYRYAGRDFRLTDVKGNKVPEIMA